MYWQPRNLLVQYLFRAVRLTLEGVPVGNGIAGRCIFGDRHVNSQDLPQEVILVLRVVAGISSATAIPGTDVEVAVLGPEQHRPAGVVAEGLSERQHDLVPHRSDHGHVRVVVRHLEAPDDAE